LDGGVGISIVSIASGLAAVQLGGGVHPAQGGAGTGAGAGGGGARLRNDTAAARLAAIVVDLYLASTSPRRRELLFAAGIAFALCEPGPEYPGGGTDHDHDDAGEPAALARSRALRKGLGARPPDVQAPVLAVDTTVDLDGEELGKPRDAADAAAMLARLAGRTHRVHTAHCVVVPGRRQPLVETVTATVACAVPPPGAIERYVASGEWRGKAGGYGIQDPSQSFFSLVDGAFDTVVGLHVPAVRRLLARARERP
jgi:septum formation protein